MISKINVCLLSSLLLAGCTGTGGMAAAPKAVQGLLDLAGWDFDKQGIVELGGDWEFYGNELYKPADFKQQPHREPGGNNHDTVTLQTVVHSSIAFPGNMNYLPVNEPLPVPGCATFRLKLRGLVAARPFALKIGYISNAYKLWAGDKIIAQAGVTGKSEITAIPAGKMCKEIRFTPGIAETELILQISSFRCTASGLKNNIILGPADEVDTLHYQELSLGFLLLGCLVLIFLFHLNSFLFSGFKRKELFFAFFVCFFAIQFFFNDFTLSSYFPALDLGYDRGVKLLMLTSCFAFLSFMLYALNFIATLPRAFPVMAIRNVFLLIAGLHTLLTLTFKMETGILITSLYETFIFPIGLLFILVALIRNRHSKGMGVLISGFGIFLVLSAVDITIQNFYLDDFNLIPWGIILFFFFRLIYERQTQGSVSFA